MTKRVLEKQLAYYEKQLAEAKMHRDRFQKEVDEWWHKIDQVKEQVATDDSSDGSSDSGSNFSWGDLSQPLPPTKEEVERAAWAVEFCSKNDPWDETIPKVTLKSYSAVKAEEAVNDPLRNQPDFELISECDWSPDNDKPLSSPPAPSAAQSSSSSGVSGHLSAAPPPASDVANSSSSGVSGPLSAAPPPFKDFEKKKVQISDDIDMVSTTAGGTTIVKEPDEMSVDEDSDDFQDAQSTFGIESHRSDATKISNSTSSDKKSIGRRTSRRERLLDRAEAKAKAEGRPFVRVSHEQHRENQRKAMLIALTPEATAAKEAATPDQLIASLIEQYDASKLTLEERMNFMRQIDELFAPKFAMEPKSKLSWDECHNRYMSLRGEWQQWYCDLCEKYADDNHSSSAQHKLRLNEMAAADEMVGPCGSKRRFEPQPGLQLGLTRKRFRSFWGAQVDNMPKLVQDRLNEGATIEVSFFTGKRKITLTKERIVNLGFGCVSYPGTGKYCPQIDKCIRWEDLSETPLLEDMPMSGNCEQLIDEKNEDQAGMLAKMSSMEKHMDGTVVRGRDGSVRGWWPVVIINWDTIAQDHGFMDHREFFRQQAAGLIPLYVTCWYQLADGSWVLVAWPVFLISRL
jgi:hypothetical protein